MIHGLHRVHAWRLTFAFAPEHPAAAWRRALAAAAARRVPGRARRVQRDRNGQRLPGL